MASLVLIVSLLLATCSYPLVEAANYSHYGYAMPAKLSLNPVDACWRRNPKWATNRQALAQCAVGYGKAAMGGKQGQIYVVTNPSDDPRKPLPGTLRFGVNQPKPLWITFARDMVIVLKDELYMKSHKKIDGRGARVEIANGPCITIQGVSHVIIHGLTIHSCKPNKGKAPDGDGIRVAGSSHVWIDHCHFSKCHDGLLDVILGSTAVSITNNYFTQHKNVMLLGHIDKDVADKKMRVTIAFNVFGPGLGERMPRVRHGYAHIANNRYEKWGLYAIGGSANPTIFSEGNHYVAPDVREHKQVTKRITGPDSKKWKWGTARDVFLNGAFFVPSGGPPVQPMYKGGEAFKVAPGSLVPSLTASAGALRCVVGRIC